jgi:hypothetical protein
MSYEFDQGMIAAEQEIDRTANPYAEDTQEYEDWNDGWDFHTNGGV